MTEASGAVPIATAKAGLFVDYNVRQLTTDIVIRTSIYSHLVSRFGVSED